MMCIPDWLFVSYTMEVLNRKYGPEFFWILCFLVIVINLYFFLSAGLIAWKESSGILRFRVTRASFLINIALTALDGHLLHQLYQMIWVKVYLATKWVGTSLNSEEVLLMEDQFKRNIGGILKLEREEIQQLAEMLVKHEKFRLLINCYFGDIGCEVTSHENTCDILKSIPESTLSLLSQS